MDGSDDFSRSGCGRNRTYDVTIEGTGPGSAGCQRSSPVVTVLATEPRDQSHLNIYDAAARQHWALRFGVTEERLRKAVTMVGSRLSTVADYLGHPTP